MRVIKLIILGLFFIIIIAEFSFIINGTLSLVRSHLLVMISFATLLYLRTRYSWGTLLILCLGGIYSMVALAPHSSIGVAMDFTNSVNYHLFSGYTSSILFRIISFFPLAFYIILVISLFLKSVKKHYNLISKKNANASAS